MTWTSKGKTKTGKLSPETGRVLVHSETWTARFIDENGKQKLVSTKSKDRAVKTLISQLFRVHKSSYPVTIQG